MINGFSFKNLYLRLCGDFLTYDFVFGYDKDILAIAIFAKIDNNDIYIGTLAVPYNSLLDYFHIKYQISKFIEGGERNDGKRVN